MSGPEPDQAGVTATRSEGRRPATSLQANVVVATGTALSRLTGYIELAIFGMIFGRAALWDAYNAANNSPNMVYELLLGGVLSATLVPIFTRLFHDEDDEAIEAIVGSSIVAVAGLALVAVIAAPLIFHLSSFRVSHLVKAADYRSLGSSLARVFLFQIFFYGLTALWGALLNTKKRFFAPAWAPIPANLTIIASLIVAKMQLKPGENSFQKALHNAGFRYTLALGATAGIALQALVMFPALKAAGIHVRFRPNFRHPAVKQVFRLSAWTIGFAASNIIAAQVIQNLARPGSGNSTAYMLAYAFFQLPHALLAMSILTTFIPDLAGSVKRRDRFAFVDRMSFGIRTIALVTVPAGFGLFALRRPIVGALLQHGRFTSVDSLVTSRALAGFALGLGGFSIYMFVLRGFYSHQDTKTPFKLNLVENLLNIAFAFLLVGRYGVLGLGLAFALAYLVTAVWALQILQYKVQGFDLRALFTSIGKTALAGTVMAEFIWLVSKAVGSNQGLGAAARIVAGGIVGTLVYGGLMWLLGSHELRTARQMVLRRWR